MPRYDFVQSDREGTCADFTAAIGLAHRVQSGRCSRLGDGRFCANLPGQAPSLFRSIPGRRQHRSVARAMQPALEKIRASPSSSRTAGAGSMLGVDAIAKAAPDGLTIGHLPARAHLASTSASRETALRPGQGFGADQQGRRSPFILVATPT